MTDVDSDDYDDLLEWVIILVDELITSEPMLYAKPKFHDIIVDEVTNLINIQLEDAIKSDAVKIGATNSDSLIRRTINEAMWHYYTVHNPRRSYASSIIITIPNINILTEKLTYLKNIPQPEQRTNEWYLFRNKVLTASSIWKAYGSEKSKNQIIYDKCEPVNLDKYKHVNMDSPMHWGQKYEDVSIEWYEKHYNTTVSEFGCIPHKDIHYLAASPDGINTDIMSKRYGRMVEVKNIYNREITGIPKLDYWIQMQVQMEVCDLNECDFLETRFLEYDTYNDFMSDGCFNFTENENIKGIIICFIKEEKPIYEYAPLYISRIEYDIWEEATMVKYKDYMWLKNIYWRLDEISCVLVLRNKFWFNSTKYILKEVWDSIVEERVTGHSHRAPTSRVKLNIVKPRICNIIMNNNQCETTVESEPLTVTINDFQSYIAPEIKASITIDI
jgi:putative phage-type endonuclease